MNNGTISIASTVDTTLPTGATFSGSYRFQILDGQGGVVKTQDVASSVASGAVASFSDLEDGSYVASVSALDSLGNVLGSPLTQPFDAPTVVATSTFPAPAALSIAFSAG